jgi:phosphate transport system ATP-binding protein
MSEPTGRPGVQIAYTPQQAQEIDLEKTVAPAEAGPPLISLDDVSVFYGSFEAVRGTSMPVAHNKITAMIGPSGCGKSTILRCLNRMNDLVPGARVAGKITYQGQDLYAPDVDAIQVRRRIGMVFQKPNPFPKSIFDNVAYGIRINKIKGNLNDMVEQACAARPSGTRSRTSSR